MSADTLKDGVTPRCQALVPETPHRLEWRRCGNGAAKGGTLCPQHQRARDRIDAPNLYVICRSFKPARRNKDGHYRKTIYSKVFTSREAANKFLHLRWGMLTKSRAGERFKSAAVEPLEIAVRRPGRRWVD